MTAATALLAVCLATRRRSRRTFMGHWGRGHRDGSGWHDGFVARPEQDSVHSMAIACRRERPKRSRRR